MAQKRKKQRRLGYMQWRKASAAAAQSLLDCLLMLNEAGYENDDALFWASMLGDDTDWLQRQMVDFGSEQPGERGSPPGDIAREALGQIVNARTGKRDLHGFTMADIVQAKSLIDKTTARLKEKGRAV